MAHLYGKLLTACSTIKHDGERVEVDEDMSPISVKRMTVLFGIDERLPGCISRIYAKHLPCNSVNN